MFNIKSQTAGNNSISISSNSSSIIIENGKIIVDGKEISNNIDESKIELHITGNVQTLSCDKNVSVVNGTVHNINANENVSCNNVTGNINAGGNVSCDKIKGNITANGNISCDDIYGDVNVYGNLKCDDIHGNVTKSNTNSTQFGCIITT